MSLVNGNAEVSSPHTAIIFRGKEVLLCIRRLLFALWMEHLIGLCPEGDWRDDMQFACLKYICCGIARLIHQSAGGL